MANIDVQYTDLLKTILKNGYWYEDPRRKGVNRKEITKYNFKYNLNDGLPILTLKKINYKDVVGELLWFLRGSSDIRELWKDNIHIWDKDWKNSPYRESAIHTVNDSNLPLKPGDLNPTDYYSLGKIYGVQWRDYDKKVDQIQKLIYNMKRTPMSSELIVDAWNPSDRRDMALAPCHKGFQIMCFPIDEVNYGFDLVWEQRSCDTFLGIPYNILSYSILMKILEKITGYKARYLYPDLRNVHLYENSTAASEILLNRDAFKYEAPSLSINKPQEFWDNFEVKNFKDLKIDDFIISNYNSYPNIKVKMLTQDK